MSLLSIENISKSFFGRPLLAGISLQINRGDRIALIGENGTGKTTLFRLISGGLEPDSGRIVKASGCVLGYLPQHTEEMNDIHQSSLNSSELDTLEAQLRELEIAISRAHETGPEDSSSGSLERLMAEYESVTRRFETAGGYTYAARMAAVLAGLGLSGDALERPVASLSGGERMRTGMARLLIGSPDLLLLDEPTNHLDMDGIEWLEDYMNHFGGTICFISHDRSFVNRTANKVCELRDNRLYTYSGNYDQYLAQKAIEQDFARQTVQRLESEVARQQGVVQTMLSHRNISGYHAREKVVAKLSEQLAEARTQVDRGTRRMNFHFVSESRGGDPDRILLRAEHLSKAFGNRRLFDGLSVELKASDKLFIAGPNGCGKSTLIKVLTGQDPDFDGRVRLSATVTYAEMGQYVTFADENRTLLDELSARSDMSGTEMRSRLARFGFCDQDVFKTIDVLSGGERSRLYLCCLLEEKPDLLFLDEPTNHLDIHSTEILEDALRDYDGAILGISHDRAFISACATRVAGFLGETVDYFDRYDQYRLAARAHAAEQRALEQAGRKSEISQKQAAQRVIRQSKTDRRRARSKLTQAVKAAENAIHALEAEQGELNAAIGPDTGAEAYERLAEIAKQLEETYSRYFELGERLAAAEADAD